MFSNTALQRYNFETVLVVLFRTILNFDIIKYLKKVTVFEGDRKRETEDRLMMLDYSWP